MIHTQKLVISGGSVTIINALSTIKNKYRVLIADNLILRNDLERLFRCILFLPSSAEQSCEELIDHIIAGIDESISRNQQLVSASPSSDNCTPYIHPSPRELRQALKDFKAAYVNNLLDTSG